MKDINFRKQYEEEYIPEITLQEGIERNRGYLQQSLNTCLSTSQVKDSAQGKEPESLSRRLEQVCDFFLPFYTRADLLAERFQKVYKRGSTFIYLFAVLAVLTITVHSLFHAIPHWTILIEIVSIVCIIFIIEYGNRIGWHRRWIDYRFLAERFRCAIFMALVGEKAHQEFSDHDLYHVSKEDKWIFTVMRDAWNEWEQKKKQEQLIPVPFELLKGFIGCGWLEDQKGFHERNIGRHERRHKQLSWTGLVLFYLTLVFAIIHFFHWGGEEASPVWALFAITFPTIGLIFTAMRAHFEHNKLVRRSRKMVNLIGAIADALEKADTMDKLLSSCRQIEILMLSETTEWHGLISFHHLEPPG